jgi:hypothetical protein
MLLKFNPHRAFFLSVLFSGFFAYISHSGIIAYGPMIIMAALVVAYEVVGEKKIAKQHLLASLSWLPYVFLAGFTYISNPFEGRYFSTHLLTIIILPLLVLSFSRMLCGKNNYYNYEFVYKSLFFFVFMQLLVCLGQLSTYTFGVGFPVSELYAEYGMITGTFANSNDLSAVTLAIIFVVIGLEKYYFKNDKYIFWLAAIVLLMMTGSRSAIVLAAIFFLFSKAASPKKVIVYGLIFSTLFFVVAFVVNNFESEALSRGVARIESLMKIFQYGISSDNSMTMRLDSYTHFLQELPRLGFGSGEVNNYFIYSEDASFRGKTLLFQNPHSLVVELGYWLGWPGLILFFLPLMFLLPNSKRKLSLVAVFLIVSMIPSSILGSMLFFLVLVLSFYDYRAHSAYHPQSSPPRSLSTLGL